MTATLDTRWNNDGQEREALELGLVRQIARPKPHFRCPRRHSILYTRRHKLCGVCGRELPKDLLFTATEALRIKALMIAEQEKHRDWLARAGQSWR